MIVATINYPPQMARPWWIPSTENGWSVITRKIALLLAKYFESFVLEQLEPCCIIKEAWHAMPIFCYEIKKKKFHMLLAKKKKKKRKKEEPSSHLKIFTKQAIDQIYHDYIHKFSLAQIKYQHEHSKRPKLGHLSKRKRPKLGHLSKRKTKTWPYKT